MADNHPRTRRRSTPDRSPSPEPRRKIKPIPASKLQAFTSGSHRMTPYLKRKEETEQKKKRESEETAKVYNEFLASFEDPSDYTSTRSFVKSKSQRSSHSPEARPSSPPPARSHPPPPPPPPPPQQRQQPAQTQQPTVPPPVAFQKAKQSSTSHSPKPTFTSKPFIKATETKVKSVLAQADDDDEDEEEENARILREARAQKKRNLDTFLEEIKKEQEYREDRTRTKHHHHHPSLSESIPPPLSAELTHAPDGSHDTGDPMTTNLYVGNIPRNMNEATLCQTFAVHGPIASVKIMWPRTQEEHEKSSNCGFVSFMSRSDAEQALLDLNGKTVQGHALKVGWGKAVPLPPKPVFVLEAKSADAPSNMPFNARIASSGPNKGRAVVQVTLPSDIKQVKTIHRTVERVVQHGPAFEKLLMERERENPLFKFLFVNNSEEHIYYRWRLYSILQGDTKSQWRTEPFQMFENGPWWVPPEVPFSDEGMEVLLNTDDEERDRKRHNVPKGVLGKVAKQRFEYMLRQVTFQRGSIARAMAFAIDHSDAADEVIDVIIKSLTQQETPLPVKLARLFLVSDILHNSGTDVPNAWKYRVGFEGRLIPVFEQFNAIYRSIGARLKAEQVRLHITGVLTAWETWMVFPEPFLKQLNEIVVRKASSHTPSPGPTAELSASALAPASASVPASAAEDTALEEDDKQEKKEDVDGEPMQDIDGEPLDDVDGEPLDIDGEPLEDVDGEPMEDSDGEPLEAPQGGDVDGEPIGPEEQEERRSVRLDNVHDMFAQ
ncbi:hypothetical protein BCR43DRAFT_522535 [Syncephalastrum racemosum]|uniref:U2 snRNP-associated SURP motif-containing protein n=1 Tax=Syncephalastrum racemosum TaxID=13706 RepID=A0A1X2HQY5_SYNRA|nr:hypothetical protein BCR43DRAFT_522535 [Syncephalastrum racemosum]